MANPDALWAVANDFLTVVREVLRTVHPLPEGEVEGGKNDPMPKQMFVSPGAPMLESCCSGQVTVHVANIYPTTAFPLAVGDVSACPFPPDAAVQLVITALRCAPAQGSGDLRGPGADELGPLAQVVMRDQYAIYRAATCLLLDRAEDDAGGIVQASTPVDVEGQCVGSATTLLVQLGDLCPCTDPTIPAPSQV